MPNQPPEPWHSFLIEVDTLVTGEVFLHCLGAFVIQQLYGLPRPTQDVDTLPVHPRDQIPVLIEKAGKGSDLHRKYRVYLDIVGICDHPDSYEDRLTELFPGTYKHIRVFALEIYDLVLAKLGRNAPRDREDVRFLATKVPLEVNTLRDRYIQELRPYLANEKRDDLTLDLWIAMIEEEQARHMNP